MIGEVSAILWTIKWKFDENKPHFQVENFSLFHKSVEQEKMPFWRSWIWIYFTTRKAMLMHSSHYYQGTAIKV